MLSWTSILVHFKRKVKTYSDTNAGQYCVFSRWYMTVAVNFPCYSRCVHGDEHLVTSFGNCCRWIRLEVDLKRVHTADQTRQNWSVANISKTTENCRNLLKTVANSVHTADADPTKRFCRVGVGGVKWVLARDKLTTRRLHLIDFPSVVITSFVTSHANISPRAWWALRRYPVGSSALGYASK